MILLDILLWLFRILSTLWIGFSCVGGLITHPLRSGGTDDWESWMGCTIERIIFDVVLIGLMLFISCIKSTLIKRPISHMTILREFKRPVGLGLVCQILILLFTFIVYIIDGVENYIDQRNDKQKQENK